MTAAGEVAQAGAGTPSATRRRSRRRIPTGVRLAVGWLVLVLAAAVFADALPLADPTVDIAPGATAPFVSWPEFLGTDPLGRSVLSRLVYGARVSLLVGVISAAVGLATGVIAGMLAGTNRGVDQVVGVLTDTMLAIPGIVLLLVLGSVMAPGLPPLLIGLAIFSIPAFVRLARANTKLVAHREYVEAARLVGASPVRVLVREIFPSVIRPVLAYAVVILAALMVAEASVSFLGLGVVPPTPSWGGMIAAGQTRLSSSPELVIVPAAVLFMTVYAFGVIGRWLRAITSSVE